MKTQIYFEIESEGNSFKQVIVKRKNAEEREWKDVLKVPFQVFQTTLQQYGCATFLFDLPALTAAPTVQAPMQQPQAADIMPK